MFKLTSFSELEPPMDIFPSSSMIMLESIVSRSINLLAGVPIEEINKTITEIKALHTIILMSARNKEVRETMKDFISNILNDPSRFEPPDTEKQVPGSLLQLADTSIRIDENFYKNDLQSHAKLLTQFALSKKKKSCYALFLYMRGIEKSKRISPGDISAEKRYYRLGKASHYFFLAGFFLNITDNMRTEISVLQKKEKGIKDNKKEVSSKGGKTRVSKYDDIKKSVASLYDRKHTTRSNKDAARRISIEIGDKINAVLSTSEPEHTIEKWIGKHKKGQLLT